MSAKQRRRRESRRHNHSETSSTSRRLVVAGGLTAGATLAMVGVAQAAPLTYTVGTSADDSTAGACTTPANNDCSLREAVSLANANAGADTIVFNSNLTGSTITLTTGEIPITEALAVNGPGASQLTIDGNGNSRIFDVDPVTAYDPVSISRLTLTDGDAGPGNGGAVYNVDGDLTISNDVVRNSLATSIPASAGGGGVYSDVGPLTINSSNVSGNHAYQGGGVGSKYGDLLITNSTVTGNYADGDTTNATSPGEDGYGGGVFTDGANTTIRGSTIAGNRAAYDGGGIYASEADPTTTLTVSNSTVANNHAVHDDGGGIWFENDNKLAVVGSTVTGNTAATHAGGIQNYAHGGVIRDSIVTGNVATETPANSDIDAHAYTFDTSFSLIGRPAGYITTTVPGSNLFAVDPQLGGLANNGGLTRTELPAVTSPVVDKGKAFSLTSDQRGLVRPIEIAGIPNSTAAGADGADMGAVELQSGPGVPAPVTPTNPKKKHRCKKKHKKHKRSAQSSKKKKCKKKKKK